MKRDVSAWLSLVSLPLMMAAEIALAGGRYYGSELLEDRHGALLGLTTGSFSTEAPFLVDPPPGLPRVSEVLDREDMERRFLSASQFEQLQLIREVRSADEALVLGAGLPEAIRNYMAGAAAWYSRRWPIAEEYFSASAAIEGGPTNPWPLMGEFMLARSYARRVLELDDPRADPESLALADRALAGFERTRERVLAGEADPLGLSIASLGEQARILKRLMRIDESVRLYAEQAALGSEVGRQSLYFMTRWARADPVALDAFLDFGLGRELLVLYAYTHFPARRQVSQNELRMAYQYRSGFSRDQRLRPADVLEQLLARLETLSVEELPATDRLAALLYRQGHFEWAERAVAAAGSPLADWVRAKLALRADRPEQAAEYFHLAMRGFGEIEWDATNYRRSTRTPSRLVAAEASLLALSRDELTSGLELMLQAGGLNWLDAAYLAEHVLTADEVKTVVDGLPAREGEAPLSDAWVPGWPFYGTPARDTHTGIRFLLARRLMREQRFEEAMEYFPWQVTRGHAERYAASMNDSEEASGSERAQLLFEAARIARSYGLKLLAWESEPDYAAYGADFYLKTGVAEVIQAADDPAQAQWMAERELNGVAEGRIGYGERYSYRYVAAELADRAADHLPPDSETFAAVLCHASRWLLVRDPPVGRAYYDRYRREGRIVDWHSQFGRRCPDPDFEDVGVDS